MLCVIIAALATAVLRDHSGRLRDYSGVSHCDFAWPFRMLSAALATALRDHSACLRSYSGVSYCGFAWPLRLRICSGISYCGFAEGTTTLFPNGQHAVSRSNSRAFLSVSLQPSSHKTAPFQEIPLKCSWLRQTSTNIDGKDLPPEKEMAQMTIPARQIEAIPYTS